MSIIVTGATGKLGGFAVRALLRRGVPAGDIVAGGRKPERLAELAALGVRTAVVDFDDPATLAAAFAGASRVLLVSVPGNPSRVVQHTAAVHAAHAADVELLAYTSFIHADTGTTPTHPDHRATEAVLAASGVPYVSLRNPTYTESRLRWVPGWRERGRVVGACGTGVLSTATQADLGDAAAAVLATPNPAEHVGRTYELGGDDPFTLTQFAAELSRQTGTHIPYVDVSIDEYRAGLVADGYSDAVADNLAKVDAAVAAGEFENSTGDLRRLLGRPTTTLAEAMALALA